MALKGEAMKINKYLVSGIFAVCVVLSGRHSTAAEEPAAAARENAPALSVITNQRDVLKGLKGIYIIVADMKREVEKTGLTKELILRDAELQLRRAGIKIMSKDEWAKEPASQFLSIGVDAFISPQGLVTGQASVSLFEKVILLRSPDIVFTETWAAKNIFQNSQPIMVRYNIKDKIDSFIDDYLAVNPKEQTPIKDTNDSNGL
jgi:hypothetical protein